MDGIAAVRVVSLAGVLACWLAFGLVFYFRRRHPRSKSAKRAPVTIGGTLLQALSYLVAWGIPRGEAALVPSLPPVFECLVGAVAIALGAGSVALASKSVKHLGKQWSIVARVRSDHRLVVDGPYAVVRHPIYTGMLGLLVATGIAVSRPWAILVALAPFAAGTWLRVRSEERLLRGKFGGDFEEYRAKVPAVVPLPRRAVRDA
jgi:protein-S-isoprenylcysteine O-methyltransferase Ste14